MALPSFVAIDFETADNGRDSACAVALVRVEDGQITDRRSSLIRPPRPDMLHERIHGISWAMVEHERPFGKVWPELDPLLEGAAYLVAHNAPFDRSVLHACCRQAGLKPPDLKFQCTVQLARKTWQLPRVRLPDVCAHLNLPLRHHDAGSDAEACARIMVAALRARPASATRGTR